MDVRYARGTQHGAYPVVMHTGLKFDSIRVARVDAGWRYKARVHEYLAPPEGPYVGLFRPSALAGHVDVRVAFNATDGPRRFQSQYFIRPILEEDLARNANDTRSIYYLARTNSGINNHSQAFYYYDLLAQRSKWDEEIYHAMVMKALESKHLGVHWHERQTLLLNAFAFKPNNMDALHALAQDHFDSGRFQLAFVFALRAVQLPVPPGLAAIENVLLRPTKFLYDYEGHRLLGFAARQIGEWAQCVTSFQHVLRVNTEDSIVRDRVELCEREQAKAQGGFVQPAVHPAPEHAAKASEIEGAMGPSRPTGVGTEEMRIVRPSASPSPAAGARRRRASFRGRQPGVASQALRAPGQRRRAFGQLRWRRRAPQQPRRDAAPRSSQAATCGRGRSRRRGRRHSHRGRHPARGRVAALCGRAAAPAARSRGRRALAQDLRHGTQDQGVRLQHVRARVHWRHLV